MIVEYVGLTHETATAIERYRRDPNETKCDIIFRIFNNIKVENAHYPAILNNKEGKIIDYGEGIKLFEGEKLFLFLNRKNKNLSKPDSVGFIDGDNFLFGNHKLSISKKTFLNSAMQIIQKEKLDFNPQGQLKSLSSKRQWHVQRHGKLINLVELKDPELAHKRGVPKLDLTGIDL